MSYAILPGDTVRYTKDYVAPWWAVDSQSGRRIACMRGRVLTVEAHPRGDIVILQWKHNGRKAGVEARHLRVVRRLL